MATYGGVPAGTSKPPSARTALKLSFSSVKLCPANGPAVLAPDPRSVMTVAFPSVIFPFCVERDEALFAKQDTGAEEAGEIFVPITDPACGAVRCIADTATIDDDAFAV
jgi:hypothetical protein